MKSGLMPDREAEILARCRAGDWSEYGALVQRYRRLVWAAVDAVLCGDESVADVVQESFIRAYEKLHTFRGSSNFSSWLYRLARNHALSFVRHRSRRPRADSLDVERAGGRDYHSILPDSKRPDREYELSRRQQDLERMLRELPQEYREVIDLYYNSELSYLEIAEVLQLPLNTVKTKLRRARLRLVEIAQRVGWANNECELDA